MKNILLIGCGHMGGSLVNSWIEAKNYSITVIDPINYKRFNKNKKNSNKIKAYQTISKLKSFANFDFVVFAVRPKELIRVFKEIKNISFNKNTTLISVIAGIKIREFEINVCNINKVVRVMPNMPAIIGEGMNCIVSNEHVKKNSKKLVNKLFQPSGKIVWLDNEDQIDMATAVSGSGPGYVFNIVDAMEKAAIKLGFKKNIAKILVHQTFKGSVKLLDSNYLSAEKLVTTVATKGGTTEAGLKIMKKNKIHNIFIKLIKSSYQRAKAQGKQK